MKPGQKQSQFNTRKWTIEFSPTAGKTVRYSLPPGNYEFTRNDGAWSLKQARPKKIAPNYAPD